MVDLEVEDIYSEPPVEGELPEELVDSNRLIEILDINLELPASKRKEIQDMITENHRAFGLDDCLGHLNQPILMEVCPIFIFSKQNTFPQYTAMILGIRIGHRNLG